MAVGGFNPSVAQGTLNRLLTQITLANFPQLNVSAPYMSKAFVTAQIGDGFTNQIPTATGVVNSPEPYVMATLVINLLRTQALAAAWLAQVQQYSVLGTVSGYSDSTVFGPLQLINASVVSIDPGGWDGTDPVVRITVTGVFYVNETLWG
jgi:hypothetical protein